MIYQIHDFIYCLLCSYLHLLSMTGVQALATEKIYPYLQLALKDTFLLRRRAQRDCVQVHTWWDMFINQHRMLSNQLKQANRELITVFTECLSTRANYSTRSFASSIVIDLVREIRLFLLKYMIFFMLYLCDGGVINVSSVISE